MDHASHLWSAWSAWCGAASPGAALGIAGALFLGGLFGSVAHCGPMCAPFVIMQLGDGQPALRRLGGVLPLYHLGRLTTYAVLGGIAGGFGGALTQLGEARWVVALLLGLAALAFLVQAGRGLVRWLPLRRLDALGERWGGWIARLAAPLLHQSASGYRLGVILGLLPCGFLYGALIAAAATGNAWSGALAMTAFALGTMPMLMAVGLLGGALFAHWRRLAAEIAPLVFLANALILAGLSLELAGLA